MNAVILAGGMGTRLAPLTDAVPKPMLPVANVPMIDYAVSHLYTFGIKNVVCTVSRFPQQIVDWCVGYRDIRVGFSVEDRPLGTAGGVLAAFDMLDDTFIVVSGDALENVDLGALVRTHVACAAEVTMAVCRADNPSLYGVVTLGNDGTVTGFAEKPAHVDPSTDYYINCGVYVVNKSAFLHAAGKTTFDFSKDLFPVLTAERRLAACVHTGSWSDLGDVRSYYRANFLMKNGGFFHPPFNRNRALCAGSFVGGDRPSLVNLSASIVGRHGNSIIGRDSRIASGSSVDNCIVLDNTVVKGRFLNAIIGNDFVITVPSVDARASCAVNPEFSTQIYNIFS